MKINYRNEEKVPVRPEPLLLSPCRLPGERMKVLLVDDVSVTGSTLKTAKDALKGHDVTTLVFKGKGDFFTPYFDKLAGTDKMRLMIEAGKPEKEIRDSWRGDLSQFKEIRKKFLLYPDFY